MLSPFRKNGPIVQIELAGKCTANCEFCDWTTRPREQQVFLETELAKKAVRDAKELRSPHISFHVTGESLDHPDIMTILPRDENIGLSTNCLSLRGEVADHIAGMSNMNIILAILWAESEIKRNLSLRYAVRFLDSFPVCKSISVQMICSERSVPHAKEMYDIFSPYLNDFPALKLFYKQPYSQEPNYYSKECVPVFGFVPEGIPESDRVSVDRMATPQSCGGDCLAIAPNPMTSILVQSDGEIKPCFYRWPYWGLGNIRDVTLKEAWESERLKEIREVWCRGDPDNRQACHDCIRMFTPSGEPVWWATTGIPPMSLDREQALKGGNPDYVPYPKPEEFR